MKDFEKTVVFLRNWNDFTEASSKLWNNDKFKHTEATINALMCKMKHCLRETMDRGEELADEAKEVCSDVTQLGKYVSIWEELLGGLCTVWMDDVELSDAEIWETKLGDYFLAHDVVALLGEMKQNYNEVRKSVCMIRDAYGLNSIDECDVQADDGVSAPNVQHDVLRLFGHRMKYEQYIAACQGKSPREIARLYKEEYGVIQLEKEKGIVTTLYKHLRGIGLLNGSISNFQKHYKNV